MRCCRISSDDLATLHIFGGQYFISWEGSSLLNIFVCLLYLLTSFSKVWTHLFVIIFLHIMSFLLCYSEKAMAPHSSTLAWKIPWKEEPGRLKSMESWRVGHDWATSLSLFPFMHWRRRWQPIPVFLAGESQGQGSLVGCRLWGPHRVGHDWSDLAAAAAIPSWGLHPHDIISSWRSTPKYHHIGD